MRINQRKIEMSKTTTERLGAGHRTVEPMSVPALIGTTLAICSMAANAASATLVSSPFSGMLKVAAVQPAVERTILVDDEKAGVSRTAAAGDSLLVLSYIPKAQFPSIVAISDLSLSTGDATLHLKAGDKVVPETRLRDVTGKAYYLVKTDPQTSTFFKKDRYFGLAENGEVLNRTFSTLSDTYLTREEVKVAEGSFTLNRAEKTGSPLCSLSAVYLGQSEGTLKFKLVRCDAYGVVNAEQVRSFAAGVKAVALPGALLAVSKADAKAIKVRVDGLPLINCNGDL
jgi:hypothetical protein